MNIRLLIKCALISGFILFIAAGCTPHRSPNPITDIIVDTSNVIRFDRRLGFGLADQPIAVIQNDDEGYMIGAKVLTNYTRTDYCIIRTDKYGTVLFSKQFGGTNDEELRDFRQTSDNGYLLSGITPISSFASGLVIKVDADGNCQWSRTFHKFMIHAGLQVQNGEYVISGKSFDFPGIYMMRLDSNGNCINSRNITAGQSEECFSMEYAKDGGFVIIGDRYPGYTYIMKTDSGFNKLWDNSFIAAGGSVGHRIVNAADDGYVFTGYTQYNTRDIHTMKVDSAGNKIWEDIRGQTGTIYALYDDGRWVSRNTDNGFIVSGYGEISPPEGGLSKAAYMMRYSQDGNLLWMKKYGGVFGDRRNAFCAIQTKDGGFAMVGDNGDIFLLKADADGNTL